MGAVITTYHSRAPGSSHHQVVSHSIVQRFNDGAAARILYTHAQTQAHTHIYWHTIKLPAVDSTDRWCSMRPVHIPTGPCSFIENVWLREKQQVVVIAKLLLFSIFSPLLFQPSCLDGILRRARPNSSSYCLFSGLFHRSDHQRQH